MEIEQIKRACRGKERTFNQLCRRFDPENFGGDTVTRYRDSWTDQLNDALSDLVGPVEEMVDDHHSTLDAPELEAWKVVVSEAEKRFAQLIVKYERADPSETTLPALADVPSNQALRAAQVNIEIDDEIVSKESKALSNEVRKFFDCGQLADEDIELALGKINVWNKRLERVKEKAYAIKRNSQCFNLNDPKVSSSENAVANLAQELNEAIDQLKAEDNKRCLHSLSKSKTASVKLPIFTGECSEDFSKFKKEVEKGMVTNRVKKDDQVSQLRECLRQDPKAFIPQDMDDIDEAWRILTHIYGDPTRVMAARKQKLMSLGPLPHDGKDAKVLKAQVEWLVSLETTLTDIMGLAASSVDMEYEAYNGSMVRTVRQLFHVDMVEELTFQGTAKFKIEKLKEFAIKLREAKQELLKDHEGEISLRNAGEGSETEREFDSSEEFDTDEDYDSDAHENGDPDEEHRHEPGGSGDA